MESQDSSHNQQPFPTVFPSQIPNNTNFLLPNNNTMIQQQNINPSFPFNTIIQTQQQHHYNNNTDEVVPTSGPGLLGIEPARKKRGRPRKYSPDNTNNNNIGLGLSPVSGQQVSISQTFNENEAGVGYSGKRNRGRPPGSVKKQLDALGLPGVGFTPHVILVNKGEDIASKIMAFSQQGPRTVCILSANGAVSNVTIRQAATSGGTVTYEGRFEIISLSGSFMLLESNGNRSRSGSLSVSLAGSDGRVLGGGVAGMLKAATPVQVIVGSFIADGKRPKALRLLSSPPPSSMLDFSAPVTKTSPSLDASSDSAGESDESPLNHGTGPYNTNSVQPHQNMPPPMYSNMGWPNSMKME